MDQMLGKGMVHTLLSKKTTEKKMVKRKLISKSFRINPEQLARLQKSLGVDESKTIRACMNVADNVIHGLFGGEVKNIFRRRKQNEELDFYEDP